jgi:hypothetical protein
LQRYYIGRRSYISVTGKPTTGRIFVKEPVTRWTFITLTLLDLALVLLLYFSILAGSFTRSGASTTPSTFGNYVTAFTRGLNAILSTTFLSAVATPIAGLIGMVIAFLVVRRTFVGKQTLDFVSNLGGAVPGTILGIGYIIVFIQAPWPAVTSRLCAAGGLSDGAGNQQPPAPDRAAAGRHRARLLFNWLPYLLNLTEDGWRYLIAVGFLLLAVSGAAFAPSRRGGASSSSSSQAWR